MIRVLHLMPHMGGGVGKAVSGLVAAAASAGAIGRHTIVCLERPEKSSFLGLAEASGCRVVVCPSRDDFDREIRDADIVQLEFWNHPATVEALCTRPLPPLRLLAWCHVSGLHDPRIPIGLINVARKILFTSPCSFAAEEARAWRVAGLGDRLGVVSSGGGLDALPPPRPRAPGAPLAAGYLGSLNYSKLHPDFVSFAAAVRLDGFFIHMIGDETNRTDLEAQCRALGRDGLLHFRGYATDVAAELAALDVLVYLLNPTHYGTAENALLEAMAMGVVPVVMDNAAEREIVEDRRTGLVIRTPLELADAIDWLNRHPEERWTMGQRAAASVRGRFRYPDMERAFSAEYEALMGQPKTQVSFQQVFGNTPADWFRAFCSAGILRDDGTVVLPDGPARHGLFEHTKGSALHFGRHFPADPRLRRWAKAIESARAAG